MTSLPAALPPAPSPVAEELPDLLSKLGRNVVGAPILLALRALKAGNLATMAPLKVTTASNGQCMYVQTASDSVSVSYCINCTDAADVAVSKVIMQVRVAAQRWRRRGRCSVVGSCLVRVLHKR